MLTPNLPDLRLSQPYTTGQLAPLLRIVFAVIDDADRELSRAERADFFDIVSQRCEWKRGRCAA